MIGVDLSQLSRLGKLSQGSVDVQQQIAVLGAHSQGHVPALARHVVRHEPQRKLRMLMEVPGGKIGVQERRIELRGFKAVEKLLRAT